MSTEYTVKCRTCNGDGYVGHASLMALDDCPDCDDGTITLTKEQYDQRQQAEAFAKIVMLPTWKQRRIKRAINVLRNHGLLNESEDM